MQYQPSNEIHWTTLSPMQYQSSNEIHWTTLSHTSHPYPAPKEKYLIKKSFSNHQATHVTASPLITGQ